jgi:hypothetical protein
MRSLCALRGALVVPLCLLAFLLLGGVAASAQPADCGPVERGPLLPGQIVTGRIDDCHRSEIWTFDGVEGQAVIISMEQTEPPSFASVDLDPFLRLFAPGGDGEEQLATQNDDAGYGFNARIQFILGASGRYRIVATAIAETFGDYQLWYTFVGLGASDRGTIRSGQSYAGLIDAANPEDSWTFEGRAGERVLIAMRRTRPLSVESLFLDPLIFLFRTDENGVDVVEELSDDEQDELDALVVATLSRGGRYRIVATRIGESFGRYELTFQVQAPDR